MLIQRTVCVALVAVFSATAAAQDVSNIAGESKQVSVNVDQMVNRAIEFLRTRGQAENGSFSGETGAAVTGLVVRGILEHRPAAATNDPVVAKAMKYIESMIQPDGGIYNRGSKYRTYETSASVLALVAANKDGQYDSVLNRAGAFLKDVQWDEGEGLTPKDEAYGGSGYGGSSRPDLSNTSFMIEALREIGDGPEDPAIQKALLFIARTQNLTNNGNDTEHADKIGDGGFYYTPAAGGQTKAEPTANGGLRSYGSMTYAGLKSMIYAGLTQDDPRVKAAMGFIREHYTLESNPGVGAQGLYYYYHTFAKSLDVAGVEVLDDADGKPHDWKADLIATLAKNQQSDGSWVNSESERWMEGDRQLVTAYALMALARVK